MSQATGGSQGLGSGAVAATGGSQGLGSGAVAAIGVDVGSTTWKAVAVDREGHVVDRALAPAHPLIEEQTARELAALRVRGGIGDEVPVGATGYGRKRVAAQRVLTEITCHARGAYFYAKRAGVLVDVGGQDSKVIHLAEGGGVDDFAMNDKCAAGTGRFLEVLLARLGVGWGEVAAQVAAAREVVAVSSTCTVFAESEIISLLAEGKPVPGILKGVHQSLASRVAALAGTLRPGLPVFMSGGVALNAAMVAALSETLGRPVEVLPEPQYAGALGAALSVLF